MIIKEMHLINFGKFSHKEISLKPGVNIIYGENEAGKTTIHTFIRGMLFGIDKQRGKASGKDLYSKYEPWDNPASYQGHMRIENNGINYRIERVFNKLSKSFRVVNEDEGYELSEEQIEALFAGLNESCYYNTISISQLGSVTDKELESILRNYAANLGATKSMEIDIKKAFSDLDEQKKKITKENNIADEDFVKRSLKDAKMKLEVSEDEQHTIAAMIEQKKLALNNLKLKRHELSEKDAKRLEEVAKQNERRDKLYQDILEYNLDVERYKQQLQSIENHKDNLQEQLAEKNIENREDLQNLTDKVVNKTTMPIVFVILMLAGIGVSVGLLAGNINKLMYPRTWIMLGASIGATLLFLILAIVKYFYNKNNKEKKMNRLRALRTVMENLEEAKHEEVYINRQLANKQSQLDRAKAMIETDDTFSVELHDYSGELEQMEEQDREISNSISKASWRLEQMQEKDIEVRKEIDELTSKLEKIQSAKAEVEAIEDAKAGIEEIAHEIRNSFGQRLNERASYYMEQITNGKYDRLTIDDKLNITINSNKLLLSSSKLSKGTVEQIYMALRLAAADILFEDEPKPILLDDAFVMYDNKRMGNTMKFMSTNMEQVIIFSCHTREKLMADKLGIKYNFIRL